LTSAAQRSEERARDGDPRTELPTAKSTAERVKHPSALVAALAGAAAAGAVASLAYALRRKQQDDGNTISGDVAVHLLNRIELLTIKLQVRHARRGGPTEIDVHHVEAGASSRAPTPG
jgi:hypothetical protein